MHRAESTCVLSIPGTLTAQSVHSDRAHTGSMTIGAHERSRVPRREVRSSVVRTNHKGKVVGVVLAWILKRLERVSTVGTQIDVKQGARRVTSYCNTVGTAMLTQF